MRVDDFIINGLSNGNNGGNGQQAGAGRMNGNSNNNNGVLGITTGGLNTSCCPTNGDVLGVNIGGLGPDCCPIDNNGNGVLGVQNQNTRMIEVPEVLGINEGRAFIEICIPIVPPGLTILFDQIQRRLVFDALVAANGKVFVNGRLIKTIPFTTCEQAFTPANGNITRVVLNNVRSVTVEAIFSMCIDLPEARRGHRVVVLESHIDSVELPNLRCPEQACIRGIVEKDCISATVKVERDVIINVPTTGAV